MDARVLGVLHRLAGAGDVGGNRAGEPGNDRLLHAPRNLRDSLEIALRSDWEAGLDNVDAHLVQDVGDLELLLQCHRRAGALLAVAERGVEDHDAVAVSLRFLSCAHFLMSFWNVAARSRVSHLRFSLSSPEDPPCAARFPSPGCRRFRGA